MLFKDRNTMAVNKYCSARYQIKKWTKIDPGKQAGYKKIALFLATIQLAELLERQHWSKSLMIN